MNQHDICFIAKEIYRHKVEIESLCKQYHKEMEVKISLNEIK